MSPIETMQEYAAMLSRKHDVRIVIQLANIDDVGEIGYRSNYKGSPAIVITLYKLLASPYSFNAAWGQVVSYIEGTLLRGDAWKELWYKYRDAVKEPVPEQKEYIDGLVESVMRDHPDVPYRMETVNTLTICKVVIDAKKKCIVISVNVRAYVESYYFNNNLKAIDTLPDMLQRKVDEYYKTMNALQTISKVLTEQEVESRTWEVAREVGVDALLRSIKWKYSKQFLGQCSRNGGRITYNPLLLNIPLRLVDTVIYHELAHLVHHNHSRDFWNLLRTWLPDHDSLNRELRELTDAADMALDL